MTIVEFLNARLAEDEQSAQWALSASGSPGRMQSEIAAKRRIIEGYTTALRACTRTLDPAPRSAHGADGSGRSGARPPETDGPLSALWAWREALKHVASVYRDHADYDATWEP